MALVDIANAMARMEDHTWDSSTGTWGSYNANSLAQKNNNPGNLRFAGQAGATQGQGGFARFASVDDGFQALQNQISLDAGRGLDFDQFINKYAPSSENRTNVYLTNVLNWLGLDNSKTKLTDVISGKGGAGSDRSDELPQLADIFGDGGEEGIGIVAILLIVGISGLVAWKFLG